MNIIYFFYFNLLVIFPLFIYIGYVIFKQYKLNLLFKILIIFIGSYLVLINLYKLIKIIGKIRHNKPISSDLGILIIMVACILFAFSLYKIIKIHIKN